MGEYTDEEFWKISATGLTDEQIAQVRLRRTVMASLGDIKIKIEPEMTDTAKAILRDMIVTELKVVFPDTIKPFEMLREEMQQMVRTEFSKDKDVLEALRDALEEDECHHKQWYLWKLAKVMGVVPLLCDIEDQGIAP